MATRRRIRTIPFGNAVGLVSFHESRPLVTAAAGNLIGVWRYGLKSGENTVDVDLELDRIQEIPLQRPSAMVGLDPDGHGVIFAACGSEGRPGRIEIWDFLKNERLARFADSSFPECPTPSVMGLHPNGRYLVFQSTRNEVLELWDIKTQRMLCRFPFPEGLITQRRGAAAGLKWSPNGEFLVVPLSTGQIRIWNIPAVHRALAELDLAW